MKTRTIFATLAVSATAVGLFAQDNVFFRSKNVDEGQVLAMQGVVTAGAFGEPGNVRFMTQEFSFSGRTVTNAPYSAEEKTESVQTLADGNRIVNTTTTHVYRDSQGRTRREVTLRNFGGDKQTHTMVTISDPVTGVSYSLDPEMKVAHQMPGIGVAKMKLEAETKMRAEMEARSKDLEARAKELNVATKGPGAMFIRQVPAPNVQHEDLGGNVMEGVSVTGTRETSTIEAGAMGNEKPISIMSERWYSPELQVEVKSVHSDPRMGQTTHTLTNISRAEPDASMFQVPSDYKQVDEGKPGVPVRKFEYHTNQ